MPEPTIIGPGDGEVIGDAPDRRVEILSDHDWLHTTWSRFGPRRAGANLHIHYHHSDLFYVLQGELTVKLGPEGDETVAPAGTLVRIPPLVVHGFRNGSDAEVRYLNFHAPGQGFADYLRGLSDFDQDEPPADGGRPVSEAGIARGDELLADAEEIAVAELTGTPGGAHVHRRHVESFYVLEGELGLTGDGREIRAGAGTWLQVPAGVAHAVSSEGPVRYLNVHTPGFELGTRDQHPV
jgi:quercetin dioxygenase-like cupin family protein